jgi:hypothetical protein
MPLIHALDPSEPRSFRDKDRDHHRIEHVFLGRTPTTASQAALKPPENEKASIERR